jgi:tRNA-2-methylthio-N6-dimethylallyladenosine synthase
VKSVKHAYYLEVYGCQMNKAEAAALEVELSKRGWIQSPVPQNADLVVIHTCYIRKTAEQRIWGRLGYYRSLKSKKAGPKILAVMGCMREAAGEEMLTTYPEIDILVSTFDSKRYQHLIDLTESKLDTGSKNKIISNGEQYNFSSIHAFPDEYKSFVPIMHGCNNFCTYCVVPYVRGREISRDITQILSEIEELDANGFKEITLLGQNVNSYSFLHNQNLYTFPKLLHEIAQKVNSIRWVRFLTSHPKDFSSELIDVIAENPSICRHIHLPVQHGSDNILKRMNRYYTVKKYIETIENLKKNIKDVTFSTDLLIGFPGETEEDLQLTMDLMREVRFQDAFMYRYNPREGTKASKFVDSLDESIKLERLSRVIELQKQISLEERQKNIGRTLTVLVEGISKKDPSDVIARTETDCMAVFPGSSDIIGTFRNVEISALKGNTLKGKELQKCLGN